MEHSDLVAELPVIEKLTAAERLKIARDRRTNQLVRHEQFEREFSAKRERLLLTQRKRINKNRSVQFIHSVMLLEAAARNDVDEVRRLLMQGIDPDGENDDGLTALHQCCIDDSEDMMKLLIEFGANVNAEDSEKWTPLHAAATCGHLHLVKYLISKGANLLAVNADGNMPYDICEDEPTLDYIESEMARRGVTQELIDQTRASTERRMLTDLKQLAARGESLEYRDSVGATPLHIASANGYLSVVEFLLDQHVATDARDHDGWQAIHAGSCWGHLDVVELLVQNGSDLNALTNNHETPFDICEDPEMKSRLAALRSEQESRARAGHQKSRRSQSASTNTRTHSIRRNSTRDKGQISKKQIKNEAIFGIQNEQSSAQQELVGTTESPEKAFLLVSEPSNGMTEALNGKFSHEDSAYTKCPVISNNNKKQAPLPPSSMRLEGGPTSTPGGSANEPHFICPPYLSASSLNDNMIDIRVSVTINTIGPNGRFNSGPQTNLAPPTQPDCMSIAAVPTMQPVTRSPLLPNILNPVPSLSGGSCTLSDLKKQRSLYRVGGIVGPSTKSSPTSTAFLFPVASELSSLPVDASIVNINGHVSPSVNAESLDMEGASQTFLHRGELEMRGGKPSQQLPKFQGETAELVGAKKDETSSCCIIS